MRHVRVVSFGRDPDDTEANLIHYEGCGLIGSHTLCGHTDRTQWRFEETAKRVNCMGCLAVRDHVLGPGLTGL